MKARSLLAMLILMILFSMVSPVFSEEEKSQGEFSDFLVVMDFDLGYDENSSSPYMERVKRAQLGPERFELVPIIRNSGRVRPPLRACLPYQNEQINHTTL